MLLAKNKLAGLRLAEQIHNIIIVLDRFYLGTKSTINNGSKKCVFVLANL